MRLKSDLDKAVVELIFRKVFSLVTGSELGFSSSLGMCTADKSIRVLGVGMSGLPEILAIGYYLGAVEIPYSNYGPFLADKGECSIIGVEVNKVIFASYSPVGGVWNIAASTLYGLYHHLYSKYEVFDEGVVDMLLMHCGEWNREYFPKNELSLLAQHIFKPEVVVS